MGEEIKIEELLSSDEFRLLRLMGFINEITVRNFYLKKQYRIKVKLEPKKTKKEIEEEITEEYNRDYGGKMTVEVLHQILFSKQYNQKKPQIIKV